MYGDTTRNVTRREALAAGLAAAGALSLAARLRGQEGSAGGAYGPFKMGLQSYSLRKFDLHDALHKTKDLGLNYWESYNAHIPTTTDAEQVQKVLETTKEHDVTVNGYGVVRFTTDEKANRTLFEFAKLMKLGYFSADPDPESFDLLDRLVEEYQIPVGIHNHGPGHRYDTIDKIAGDDQEPPSPDRLLHRHGPLPPLPAGPGPRGRGLRQADLRRPPEGRQGRHRVHRRRQGGPPHGRPAQGPGRAKVPLLPGPGVRGEPGQPDRRHQGLPGRDPRGHRQDLTRFASGASVPEPHAKTRSAKSRKEGGKGIPILPWRTLASLRLYVRLLQIPKRHAVPTRPVRFS